MAFWSAVASFFKSIGTAWKAASTLQKISYVFTAVTAAIGVKGFMQARQMLAKGQDILANKTSAGGKIPVIFGTRRVGAQIIYMDVSANDSRDLYVVYALSIGECDEILGSTIELDGNSLRDSARFRDGGYIGTDKISSGSGSLNTVSQNGTGINAGAGQFGTSPTSKYRYVMNLHHGAATQTADPMLVASMPNWTTAHKLNGVAYICAHYGYDKEGIWKGIPQLTVQVKGRRVYDPRESSQTFGNSSTYAYSNNPALCFLDFITDDQIGKGLQQSEINMSTFSAAATLADYEVEQPFFNGSAKPLTWSGNSGDDFITINGTSANNNWWQSKITELINIYDSNGNGIITGKEIKDAQRDEFYDASAGYAVYIDHILDSDYTNESGSYLIKSKRFHCNGVVNTNNNVMDNAKELLANMRGIFLYINGTYELKIEDSGTPTFNITEDHIIGDSGISIDYGKKDARANKVVVEFFNANKKYELDTATVLHTSSVQGEDYTYDDGGEELEIKAEFAFCTDPYIANNMAKAILTRSRNQLTMAFIGSPTMYLLNVGDIVSLTYAGLGFSSKQCVVEALELQPNGLVSVNLIEYFDVYTWVVPPQEPLEQLSNLPSAYAVKPPTGLAFTDTDSSDTGRPFLSWNEPTDFPTDQYRVNVVDDTGNQYLNKIVDVTRCELNFTPTGNNYVATVTSLNSLGVESTALSHTFNVVDMPAGTPDIKDDAITNQKLGDGSVTNVKVLNLSAGKINTGELNLGQASGMAVRQTKTGYASTATGFWLGNDGGTPKFNIGTSTNYLKFDGSNLNISGNISATTGTIGGFDIGTTSIIDDADSFGLSSAVTAGDDVRFFAGNTLANKNIAPFRITEAGNLTALSATITGALTLTNVDGTTVTYTGGNLGVGSIGGTNINPSSISTSKLLAHATSIINPVSATGNVYRYGGYNDIGTVVNAIPSAITLSYNSSENALSLVSDGNTSIRSDSFEIDHNSIYKLSLQIKKTTTGGRWYVGATQFTSFVSGSSSDGGNGQTSTNFGVYDANRAAGTDAYNVYFASRVVNSTSYSEMVVYLIGSEVDLDEVPNHYYLNANGTPYVRLASSSTHAGIRILNWGNDSTTRTLLVKNITMAKMTANTIVAENIFTTNLAAINSDLGSITAGSLNINSVFTVSPAGFVVASSGTIGGFTLGTTSLTNPTANSKIQIGSGSSIFTVDSNGIYTGNSSFASAPFKVNASGSVQTTNSFTAGTTGTSNIAVISGSDATYRFWSGNQSPTSANFSVDKTGKVVAQHLVLKLLDGTVFFDSSTGFSSSALSQISTTTGTKVSTISSTFDANTEFESVTVTEQTTVNVSVSLNTLFGGSGSSNQDEATAETNSKAKIPDNFTLTIEHSSDGGASYTNPPLVSQEFTKVDTGTPTANQYKITTDTTILFIGGQGGIAFESNSSTDIGAGCVDSTGNTVLTYTGLVLTVSGVSTTHRIKATVSTTDSSYDTINKVTPTAPRVLQTTDPSGGGFYVSDGDGTQVAPSGDITRVQITTDSSSGLTGGANFLSGDALFTLGLASTIAGNKTFSNNVIIGGDLDVQGTTTTIDTAIVEIGRAHV